MRFEVEDLKPRESQGPYRVMVGDSSQARFKPFFDLLDQNQIDYFYTSESEKFIERARLFSPDVVIINLFLGGATTLSLIQSVLNSFEGSLRRPRFILLTAQVLKKNLKEFVRAGVSDCLVDPFEPEVLMDRVRYQLQDKDEVIPSNLPPDQRGKEEALSFVFQTLQELSELKDLQEGLFFIVSQIHQTCQAQRVNVVYVDIEKNEALNLASSDNRDFSNRPLNLEKYPELREVALSGKILFLKDIHSNPLTKHISSQVKDIQFESLVVLPLRHKGEVIGTISIRVNRGIEQIGRSLLEALYLLALALAPKVYAAYLVQKMKRERA